MDSITARHIQDFTNATNVEPHWGYADRIVPCTNDAGSCAYLDVVYEAHDVGMLYTGILWSTIGGILLIWGLGGRVLHHRRRDDALLSLQSQSDEEHSFQPRYGTAARLRHSIASWSRRYLLPDFAVTIFGHTTRLQVLVLFILCAYLTLWTFVGIVYNIWITPVKSMPGVYNTRTSLGPWADRIGVIAYALTPLSILLSSRESLLSLITGLPYQSFMFLHRWLGYVIIVQSALHTIGWCVVEWRLYQPQPTVWNAFISQLYIIWGVVAMVLLLIMFLLSTAWSIKGTGYEFFRKSHYVLAMVYIGAIIGHWSKLQCFLIPGLVLWFLDRLARLVRTALLHYGYLPDGRMGFAAAQAIVTRFEDETNGDIVRLDVQHIQEPWEIGQHFYLCFPESSIWQSHPLTPSSLPIPDAKSAVKHTYIFRAKKGETRKIAQLAKNKTANMGTESGRSPPVDTTTTPVVFTGPYGTSTVHDLLPENNLLYIAGGTGITYVLPVLLQKARETRVLSDVKMELYWAVRTSHDMEWVSAELNELRAFRDVRIHIFVTREARNPVEDKQGDSKSEVMAHSVTAASSLSDQLEVSSRVSIHQPTSTVAPGNSRPHVQDIVQSFVSSVVEGSTAVYASGPGGMIGDVRSVVARCNDYTKVWKGEQRHNVRLLCDDRLE